MLTPPTSERFRQKLFSIGTERDPVAVYKIYRDKRPKNMMADDAPFYLGMNYTRKDSSKKIWLKAGPMGVNIVNTLMKTMAFKANINNERLTNHSARKHIIQKINANDIPPTSQAKHHKLEWLEPKPAKKKYIRHLEQNISNTDEY